MPYKGEFATYQPLRRIAETARVQGLLRRSRVHEPSSTAESPAPTLAPTMVGEIPDFVVAIDGSNAEVDVVNGYPGARVGYCTVASVLIKLKELEALDDDRPIDPVEFRKTEEAATIDAALPGCNVVTRDHHSAMHSFRETLFEVFSDIIVDEDDRTSLVATYDALLALKPTSRPQACPYEPEGCDIHLNVGAGLRQCACDKRRPLYSTDALRIHEGFRDFGPNGEAYGEVMQVWERILLVHLLRCFERREWLGRMSKLVFLVDGPLAVFGHPAWLSAAITTELKRLNAITRKEAGHDLTILGIEKTGAFVDHFEAIDTTEEPGRQLFDPRSYLLLTDGYIKDRIIYSDSDKRYGRDTYFGRKFFYKTLSGARIVATIPFLTDEQDTLESVDPSPFTQFGLACTLLDRLVSSRYPNALAPIVSANAQAAIPLHLGAKVLQQLARALIQDGPV